MILNSKIGTFWSVVGLSLLAWSPLCHAEHTIPLAGTWRFQLDPENVGESKQWFNTDLPESIQLPGTTDLAGKGYALDRQTMTYPVPFEHSTFPGKPLTRRVDERGFLVREQMYLGPAWYQRTITIPEHWNDQHVQLHLERVMWTSRVWVNDQELGRRDSLVAPHHYHLGQLAPGTHRLTICVDNTMAHNTGTIGHAYGPETQSRWNGIVGEIELVATDPIFIRRVQVYPAADRGTVRVRIHTANHTGESASASVTLSVQDRTGGRPVGSLETTIELKVGEQSIDQVVPIDQPVEAWDEFHPVRYQLVAELKHARHRHVVQRAFGFRHMERRGRHLFVNGRRVFMRGTLDCCVYPNTGHAPMTVDQWLKVLGVIKQYGFNHVRYHSWCPPQAAFEAADRLGLYLAPETSFWVDGWTTQTTTHPKALGHDAEVTDFIRREIARISEEYGNHPSFAMFCIGNEFAMDATDWGTVNRLIADAKRADPRHLVNASTARKRMEADDFWVTHHSGKATRGVGPAHTNWDFTAAAHATDLPVIAHETGQRPVFPDYDNLLSKFTGPLKPFNYTRLQEQLISAGMAERVRDFTHASAKFQFLQYKAEHEAMLRTPDSAGYQLLMLNDFTGQSEALVGILDPFWETKGVVSADEVRQWNQSTVPLARFDRYTWTTDQTFQAIIEVAHYGPTDLDSISAEWSLKTPQGRVVGQGQLGPVDVPTGGVTKIGPLKMPLDQLQKATALSLQVQLGTAINRWTVWVYPSGRIHTASKPIRIVSQFDAAARRDLAKGGRMLWLAHGLKSPHTKRTGFPSVYWSAGWWGDRFSSLGIVCDPAHPALADFPNDGHSDWQWHELLDGATTFDLTAAGQGWQPIVQPVPDFHYNRLLGQVFETRVGKGRLLVCGYDLTTHLSDRPAARQMRHSLLRYMESDHFHPSRELDLDWLQTTAESIESR